MTRFCALCLLLAGVAGCGRTPHATATISSEDDYQQGLADFEQHRFDEAARRFDTALRRGGLNADLAATALLLRAKSCIRLGRLIEALHDLEDAGNGPVPVDEVLAARGEIAVKQGDLERARELLTQARQINPQVAWPESLK